MNFNPSDKDDTRQQLLEFLSGTSTLMLATVNAEGQPEASYAPYVELDGSFYIFISGLASHTANLKQSGMASALFTETNENDHAFTRRRLSCQCDATVIPRGNTLFETAMQLMEKRFGKLVATLRGLGDFQLFRLEPVRGNFVAGFGQAFEIDFPIGGDIRHRRPT